MITITLTDQEQEQLRTILACHIDLTLMPALQEAAKSCNSEKVVELGKTIELEQKLLYRL